MCFQSQAYEIELAITTVSYNSMHNTLGISLGTRFLGMAVIYDGELTDYRVRTFYEPWSKDKKEAILETIRKTALKYGVTGIYVKTPGIGHYSPSIEALIRDLRGLSEAWDIRLATLGIIELKEQYRVNAKNNKEALVNQICQKYPEHRRLAALCKKKTVYRSLNYIKMFEAIVCAEIGAGL